jgi:hypothetical protein
MAWWTTVLSCAGLAPTCSRRRGTVVAEQRLELPQKIVGMGRIEAIEYTDGVTGPFDRTRDAQRVRTHRFRPMPICAFTDDGHLWFLGGSYRVDLATRTIVDVGQPNRVRRVPLRVALRRREMLPLAERYRAVHWGNGPHEAFRVRVERPDRHTVALGYLTAITYWAKKDEGDRLWRHPFGQEKMERLEVSELARMGIKDLAKAGFRSWSTRFGQPAVLAARHQGRQLYVVGGDYTVTVDGITDAPR